MGVTQGEILPGMANMKGNLLEMTCIRKTNKDHRYDHNGGLLDLTKERAGLLGMANKRYK